jgi:N-acyl-D-amino-acid deacylase
VTSVETQGNNTSEPDLAISGGLIVDGTGAPGYYATLEIRGDTVAVVRGTPQVRAHRVIDATGCVVAPGFIDLHAHSGLMILADARHEAKVRQGVTTEVIGVDGNSYAPFLRRSDLLDFVDMNSGLDGRPSVDYSWSSVSEYLDLYDRNVAVNIAYVVGNVPLRVSARGWASGAATDAELRHMKSLLRESLEQGAYGLSSGLDYPPGSFASTEELISLGEVVAEYGGIYHTHVRNTLGDRFLDPQREAIEIGKAAGIPTHITHLFKRVWPGGGARDLLGLVEDAVESGLDVTFDTYPYSIGSSRLVMVLPPWAHDGGVARLRQALASSSDRKRLMEEVGPRGASWQEMWLTNFSQPSNRQYEGLSVSEIAALRGEDPITVVCDLLLDEDLQIAFVSISGEGYTRHQFISHPLSMVGSDGLLIGDFPSPRSYGTFPYILGKYVRQEGYLSLTEAVRKMTSLPAQRLGIADRGILRDGFKADVVIFDAKTVNSFASRREPRVFPVGISHVIVNGVVVIDGGVHTEAIPGRALRRGE